jgi:hypothetical protein
MQELYESKGSINDNVSSIVMLVIGVGVGVLVLIFVGVLGASVYDQVEPDFDTIGGHVSNESINLSSTPLNVSLAHDSVFSVSLLNNSGSSILNNVTLFKTEGYVAIAAGSDTLNNHTAYAAYDYGATNVSGSAKEGILSGFEALEKTGDYMPIIVIATIIAIVLGLVLGMGILGLNRGGGSSGAL